MAIEILSYHEGRYFGEHDPSSGLPSKHPKYGTPKSGDYYKSTGSSAFSFYDVENLTGYGLKQIASGDTTFNFSGIIPFTDSNNSIYLQLGAITSWTYGYPPGMYTWAGEDQGNQIGVISFKPSTAWHHWSDRYYNTQVGFYWFCLPGSNGTAIKFWYDYEKVLDTVKYSSENIYIDQAGCLWLGDPETSGIFICGPAKDAGNKKNIFNLYIHENDANSNFIGPSLFTSEDNATILRADSANFKVTGLGLTQNWDTNGGAGNISNGEIIYFEPSSGTWQNFADVPEGFYELETKFYDGVGSYVEGSKIKFWYNKDTWENRLKNTNSKICIDQLGNAWKEDFRKGLLLWNKLGSFSELTNSEVGSNARRSYPDTPINALFSSVYFDNGVKTGENADQVFNFQDVVKTVVPSETAGCIEFWVKFTEEHDLIDSTYHHYLYMAGEPLSSGGIGWIKHSSTGTKYLYYNGGYVISDLTYSVDDINHLAFVWDNNSIDDSGDYARLYKDNVIVDTITDADSSGLTFSNGNISALYRNPCYRDNIKVWGYAKTDFSDRFTEVPSQHGDEEIITSPYAFTVYTDEFFGIR